MKSTTVAIIKPDGVKQHAIPSILANAQIDGLVPVDMRMHMFTPEEIREFYSDLVDKPFFPEHERFMTSGPSLLILFGSPNSFSFEVWRRLMGPTDPQAAKGLSYNTIRGTWGTYLPRNVVHGSDSPESVRRETELLKLSWVGS